MRLAVSGQMARERQRSGTVWKGVRCGGAGAWRNVVMLLAGSSSGTSRTSPESRGSPSSLERPVRLGADTLATHRNARRGRAGRTRTERLDARWRPNARDPRDDSRADVECTTAATDDERTEAGPSGRIARGDDAMASMTWNSNTSRGARALESAMKRDATLPRRQWPSPCRIFCTFSSLPAAARGDCGSSSSDLAAKVTARGTCRARCTPAPRVVRDGVSS